MLQVDKRQWKIIERTEYALLELQSWFQVESIHEYLHHSRHVRGKGSRISIITQPFRPSEVFIHTSVKSTQKPHKLKSLGNVLRSVAGPTHMLLLRVPHTPMHVPA